MYITTIDSESLCGYKQITTFFQDFSIAEMCGIQSIQDTFHRAFNEWKDDYKYLTELVLVLNWKIWQWYGKNDDFAETYNNLWEYADLYACENLHGEEADYFFQITD